MAVVHNTLLSPQSHSLRHLSETFKLRSNVLFVRLTSASMRWTTILWATSLKMRNRRTIGESARGKMRKMIRI